ncbi:MAG: hypothetical protein AAGD34_21645 [Pseudomonadota bacterium]
MFSSFKTRLTVPCTVEVSHTFESLHAHVVLPDGIDAEPGDEIIVHGTEIRVPYGEVVSIPREATIVRATLLERLWVRMTGDLEFMELCEFSFSEKVAA